MEAAHIASEELRVNLTRTLELLGALAAISAEKEGHVAAGDIENLRAATEKEEELIAELGKQEKDRERCADALSKAIGLFGNNRKLSELIGKLAAVAPDAGRRLDDLKTKLDDAVKKLSDQNDKLSQLLALQINYTEYMLNLIYIPRSKSHTYTIQGNRKDVPNDLSLLDLHI